MPDDRVRVAGLFRQGRAEQVERLGRLGAGQVEGVGVGVAQAAIHTDHCRQYHEPGDHDDKAMPVAPARE